MVGVPGSDVPIAIKNPVLDAFPRWFLYREEGTYCTGEEECVSHAQAIDPLARTSLDSSGEGYSYWFCPSLDSGTNVVDDRIDLKR